MSKTSNDTRVEQIIEAIELLIESKVKILKELDYENHSEASKIQYNTYEPVKKLLKELLTSSKNNI